MLKKLIAGAGLFALAGTAFAAAKPCEELKAEIEAKLQAKGVASYRLEIVDTGSVSDQQVVGSCEGGARQIVYLRG